MSSWERFSTFAREPERRKVGVDARLSSDGTLYVIGYARINLKPLLGG